MSTINSKKVTKKNHTSDIKTADDRVPVYGKKFNDLIDELKDGNATDLDFDTIAVDTINESTAANGVSIDSVTLKDGGIVTDGTVVHGNTTTTSGAGAVPVTGAIHEITTTGTGDALTLADGTEGQHLFLVYVAEGAGSDTAVLTPSNLAGGSTVTFNDVGDAAHLMFTGGNWYKLGGAAAIS